MFQTRGGVRGRDPQGGEADEITRPAVPDASSGRPALKSVRTSWDASLGTAGRPLGRVLGTAGRPGTRPSTSDRPNFIFINNIKK